MAELLTDFIDRVTEAFSLVDEDTPQDLDHPNNRGLLRVAVDLVDAAGTWERNFAVSGMFIAAFRAALNYRYPEVLVTMSIEESNKSWDELGDLAPLISGFETREEAAAQVEANARSRGEKVNAVVRAALDADATS